MRLSKGRGFENEIVALLLPVLHFSANFLIGVVDVIAGELGVGVNPCPVQEVGSVSVDVLNSQTKRLLQRPIRRRVFQNAAWKELKQGLRKQLDKALCNIKIICFLWKSWCGSWRFSTVIHSYCFSYIRNNITNVPYFRVKITWNFCADDDRFIFMLIPWFDFFDLNCWSLVKQPIGTDAAFELRLQLLAVGTQRAIRGTKNFTWLAGHQTLAVTAIPCV